MNARLIIYIGAVAIGLPAPAFAQSVPLFQEGQVLPNDVAKFTRNGVARNPGGVDGDNNGVGVNPFAVTDYGQLGFCSNGGKTGAAPWSALCLGHDPAGAGILSLTNRGGGTATPLKVSPGSGMVVGNPTGGAKGPGTINAEGLFVNGSPPTGGGATPIPATCTSIEKFNGLPNGSDTSIAWNAAVAAGTRCIAFGPGTYDFQSPITFTMTAALQGLSIQGASSTLTRLVFHTAGGLTVNYFNKYTPASLQGFSVLAGVAGGTGITLNRTTSDTQLSLDSPATIIHDVAVGWNVNGADWNTCFAVNGVSNVNYRYIACNNTPINGYGGVSTGLVITGTAANPSVVHNISNANISWGSCGILLNPHTEGVTIAGSNFTLGNKGVCVPADPASLPFSNYQLVVSDSQFNNNIGIEDLSGFSHVMIHDNLFVMHEGSKGIYFGIANYVNIHGNMINGTTPGPNSNIGIEILTAIAATGTVNQIHGNQLSDMDIGIRLDNASRNTLIGLNTFNGNATPILNNAATDVAGFNIIADQVFASLPTVTPGPGACGSSPLFTPDSTDQSGALIVGTGVNGNQCTVAFGRPFARVPSCIAQSMDVATIALVSAINVNGFVVSSTGPAIGMPLQPGLHINYRCSGYQ